MRVVVLIATLCLLTGFSLADTKPEDSVAAARTRKLLKTKISVEFRETRLEDAMDEIKEMVKGFRFMLDTKGGVSRNQPITFKADNKSIEDILDQMLKKPALGYVVISRKGNAYDGLVQIRKSDERGYPKESK